MVRSSEDWIIDIMLGIIEEFHVRLLDAGEDPFPDDLVNLDKMKEEVTEVVHSSVGPAFNEYFGVKRY